MSGEMRGCAARITDMYPKALYIHCCSHALNLCVMGASKCKLVLNLWTALREVAFFFNSSPKRQQKLMDVIKATADNEEKATKLTDLCRTRWAARHTALVTFDKLYDPVVQCLEDISTAYRMEWNVNTSSQASSFLKLVVGFDFIASFVVVSEVMSVLSCDLLLCVGDGGGGGWFALQPDREPLQNPDGLRPCRSMPYHYM